MLNKRIFLVMFLLIFLFLVGCVPSAPPVDENQAPVIISVPITDAEVGVGYIYNVGATDPDEDSLIYSLIVKPNGMFINSITGLISWNPNSAQVGNNSVTVEVSDGELSDTQSFIIVVEEPCVPPCPEPDPCDPPCPPTPQEVKLISIVVVPKTMTLFVGETENIVSVTAHYNDGSTFVINQQGNDYGNGSDDNSVATVSVSHVVTAVAKGTATITVMYEDKTDTIEVTVAEVEVIGIKVSPDEKTLLVGETQFLTVTAYYNDGSDAVISGLDCVFAPDYMSQPASVSSEGLITAHKRGEIEFNIFYTPDSIIFVDSVFITVEAVIVIDGILSSGEWDGVAGIDLAGGKGIAIVFATTDYLYVAFHIDDPTDKRLGDGLCGNDKLSINVNPTDGGIYGKPYDVVFQTGTDPAAFTTTLPAGLSSGISDSYETEWVIDGTQFDLPFDLETMTLYGGGHRVSEWKIPLVSISPLPGTFLEIGGNADLDVGGCNGYTFPATLLWADVSTYVSILVE